jgi:hypothetical protein
VVSQPAFGGIPPGQLLSLFGLLAGWPLSQDIHPALPVVVAAGSAALLMIVAALRKCAQDKALFRLCFAGAVMTALLVGLSTNSYDLSLLVVPLAVIVSCGFERVLDVKSLIAPAVPLLISPLWFYLWMRWHRINLMAVFLLWWLFILVSDVRRLRRLKGKPLSRPPLIANV